MGPGLRSSRLGWERGRNPLPVFQSHSHVVVPEVGCAGSIVLSALDMACALRNALDALGVSMRLGAR